LSYNSIGALYGNLMPHPS